MLEGRGVLVDTQFIVDGQYLVLVDHDFLAGVVVVSAGVGDDGVHEVIAPGQLDHH